MSEKSRKRGRPPHEATPELRQQIETMVGYGIPHAMIGRILGISERTIRNHYKQEIATGTAKANVQIAGFLFAAAKAGNITAQIFWLKARAGWEEAAS
jgi:DNA-binding NarL/FixJ family response regulator